MIIHQCTCIGGGTYFVHTPTGNTLTCSVEGFQSLQLQLEQKTEIPIDRQQLTFINKHVTAKTLKEVPNEANINLSVEEVGLENVIYVFCQVHLYVETAVGNTIVVSVVSIFINIQVGKVIGQMQLILVTPKTMTVAIHYHLVHLKTYLSTLKICLR